MSCCLTLLRRLARPLISLWLVAVLSACSYSQQTFLEPKTYNSQIIYELFVPIFWAAVIVFIVVEAVLFYSVFRFRTRDDGKGIPAQWHGNTVVEILWTIAPAIVLGVIFFLTARSLFALSDPPKTLSDGVLNIRVIGHQWWWEFEYLDYKMPYKTADGKDVFVSTATDLHVPVGYTVKYSLESVDVIHSFWVPSLNGKTDLIPGHINHGSFIAQKTPGEFWGQCAEFCGAQHAEMRFKAMVDSKADFDKWMAAQQAMPVEPSGLAKEGKDLFTKPENLCASCHTVAGIPTAVGKKGPNLTHLMSRKYIAGGISENTPENLRKWINNPDDVKKDNEMWKAIKGLYGNFKSADEKNKFVDAIVAYLQTLK